MSTRASVYRHPVHPMLIVLPLGLWVFAAICYLIYLLSGVPVWRTVSLHAMGGGIIGGVLAAIPGAIDFLTLPKSRVQTIALSHRISNVVALTIFIIAFALAVFGQEQSVVPFVLSVFGLLAVGTGGWLGGALVWADGIYFHIRLEEPDNNRQCILVLMGATPDGRKELIAITDGYRESADSWRQLLLEVQQRGLTTSPKVATGDGALGFWVVLRELYPQTREQRCWVHKTANILDKMPKSLHEKAKALLQDIWMAATRKEASRAFGLFVQTFEAKYPKAVECLVKDQEVLLTFYDFPAEHWIHLRTTNPIESTFATVRLRTVRTKGSGSRTACLTMVFTLAPCAEKHWRRIHGQELIPEVIRGVKFVDGIREIAA